MINPKKKYDKFNKDDKSGIYQIYCEVNKKSYIGQAFHVWYRLRHDHFRTLVRNKHPNKYLQAAWNKYGAEKFEWSVVKLCEIDELNDEEVSIIAELGRKNLFNSTNGGEGIKGYEYTEEHRKNLSAARKGVKLNLTDERRQQLRDQMKEAALMRNPEFAAKQIESRRASGGFIYSEESLQKMSIAHLGKKHTPEQYAKISAFLKGDGAKQRHKSVERIDPITGEVKEYESIKAAALEGFHAGHISDVLRGLTDTHKNYYWQFINANDRKVNSKPVTRKVRVYKTKAIERIDMITGEVTEYKGLREADRAGFNRKLINSACNGKITQYRSYFWQYLLK